VEFEPTIPPFERAKTVHALDRAATVIGKKNVTLLSKIQVTNHEDVGSMFLDSYTALKPQKVAHFRGNIQ
jgi:hypothetical protein